MFERDIAKRWKIPILNGIGFQECHGSKLFAPVNTETAEWSERGIK